MQDNYTQYLEFLNLQPDKPGLTALTRIIQSHLTKIPFENISKLYRLRTTGLKSLPVLTDFLEGIIEYNFGGTCYSNNYYLNLLLNHLGYDVKLCGADMSQPDVHIVNLVKIDGREYLVDAGNAAPFLEPIPLDLEIDYKISLGLDEYILQPREINGRSRMLHFRNRELLHGYYINPASRKINEFEHIILDSFRPEATFMNAILLVRIQDKASQVIHNMTLIESQGSSLMKRELGSIDELIAKIKEVFGIPADISALALEGISLEGSAWG
jgi:arylamine N-acetyltransferase